MANIFIIHSSFGNPEENWFPWLKEELEKDGHNVFVPKFPTPENQSLNSWLGVFKKFESKVDENTILIGHSLGPAFILTLLETKRVQACFFVSGFLGFLNNPEFDEINKTFMKEFNWENITSNCKIFNVYHSDNDPYVPSIKAEELAKKLETEVKIIENAGHFNTSSGYDKFIKLLEDIKKIV